ncbi:uncharacterized protein LOC127001486 isoform X2 [Eriocheir sinensis]|uniref:uncharacterized protein LOC127001486 isoform X2 n=1 Tax=Eriocheir sinensis TaxID=95602 RepID=UPI0021C7E944|nr:uncharacterized protein LOC127001486 isoform X2 [Eriocheir sinensis]
MDNFMHRGGRMLGSSKLYGSNRPQGNEWRPENSRMVDASRLYKDSQIQETSRQREGFRMQDSRLLMESGLEQNYSPPRIFNVSEVQGSGRIPDRPHGGTQLQREVRVHQDSRMESGNRLQENSRMYNMPPQDHLEPRSSTVAYDYNHRRPNDADSFKDIGTQSKFMNSHENMRSGRNYILEENESAKQEFLGTLPKNNSLKKNLELLLAQSHHGSVKTPGPSHILTPSLTTSTGHPTGIGMRPIGNRDSYPKEKSSKAFDYLKTWRLKMNMPTDSFLLEKEGIVGNQQQGVDVMPHLACDDLYTQPPTTEPRRASIDPEWNCSGNSFADKETYGERPGNKYGNMRYGSYGESLVDCPKGQSLESDRTGNPPWKWAEELPSGQNEGAKRNYESMALGQSFNHANRDGRLLHDTVQPKRPRLSPSIMESERRGNMEQYTSVISEQANLSQNVMESDDAKIRIGASNTFYEPQSDWISPFHSKPLMDSSRFSRSCDNESESVSFRHKLPYREMNGVGARERSQTSYIHSRDVKSVPHLSTEGSPEPLGRHKYTELQDQASRFSGQGAPRAPRPISTGQQRSPSTQERPGIPKGERSSEFGRVKPSAPRRGWSPGHHIRERSPGPTRRERLPASPGRGRLLDHGRWSPGRLPAHSGREKSPEPFRRERPPASAERRKSPLLLGKGTSHGVSSVGGRSPGPLGGQSSRPLERGRPTGKSHVGRRSSPGASEKGKLPSEMSSKSGRGKSPGPERSRSSGIPGRVRSPGADGSYRLPRLPGKGKQTDGSGRRSPRQLNTGKPTKTVKGGSTEQQQPRSVSAATGVSVDRKGAEGEQSRSSQHSRGRSPLKGRSPVGTRMRSESFRDGKQRPRIRNRSPQSPVKRISSDHRGKNEALYPSEYRDYKMKNDRSPYLEEVSLSPRASRYWSPTGRGMMNIRSHHSRERSLSADALQRGCSPVSVQSEDNQHQNIYPREPFFADREGHVPREHSPHAYPSCSPHSVDGYTSARKNDLEVEGNKYGSQQERLYSFSREVPFDTGRQSMERIHNTKGIWREHNEDRGGQHIRGKKGSSGKISSTTDVKISSSTKYAEKPEGTLLEEEVDDEDLRIHLLRLREQKVEMKLMKLEEESKETELKLLELKSNQTIAREKSPLEEERRYPEKEPFVPLGRKQETYPWKRQHSAPQSGRFHRQHKRF